jgi:ribosome-associated protein
LPSKTKKTHRAKPAPSKVKSAGSKRPKSKAAAGSHKTDSPDRKRTPGKLAIKLKAKATRNSKAGLPRRAPGRVEQLAAAQSVQVDSRKARQTAESTEIAKIAIEAALDKKALLPVLIDVSAMASYTDFIAIVSGRSDRHVDAIAEGVLQAMKARGRTLLGQEGSGSGRWTLLDFGDIVVHVFYHPVREFYDLESLWVDAPRLPLKIPPESVMAQPDALYGNL